MSWSLCIFKLKKQFLNETRVYQKENISDLEKLPRAFTAEDKKGIT